MSVVAKFSTHYSERLSIVEGEIFDDDATVVTDHPDWFSPVDETPEPSAPPPEPEPEPDEAVGEPPPKAQRTTSRKTKPRPNPTV
jgi:hypothetical protein